MTLTETNKVINQVKSGLDSYGEILSLFTQYNQKMNEAKPELNEAVIKTAPINSLLNKPIKSLLSMMSRNSKRLAKHGELNFLNENILISTAITLQAIKNAKIINEVEEFVN